MGSSSSKEKGASKSSSSRAAAAAQAQNAASTPPVPFPPPPTSPHERQERLVQQLHAHRILRDSRPDLPFLGLVRDRDHAAANADRPRETRQEREARKVERERQARLKERERSLREESVDGGYLVTLGVYTGPEDFSKPVVRQLQIERRLAPFWRGLNEHSDSWTEGQLVAAARGLPIPAPDEIPPHMARTYSEASSIRMDSDANLNSYSLPIVSRSISHDSGASGAPSPIQPALSTSGPTSPINPSSSSAQLFRGRAKTLASLATGTKSHSPDLTPQEIHLPKEPCVNGQPVEAYLYKDAAECPICFMYYPPYLNRTRCCDQPICSECFVQIKRPDPHPPEHEQPGQERPPEEEAELLVSEVAACPFCVTPEFGISYDPPPFRRGLAYAKQPNGHPLQNPTSAMSSSSSLNTTGRRRTASLSANAPQVITTDRIRPDWAKKLADARAHVLRRSAAATALHNAAYVLGNQGDGQFRALPGFRRRRSLFADGPGVAPRGAPEGVPFPYGPMARYAGIRPAPEDGGSEGQPGGGGARRSRVDDLEELMMMEAIRLSLVAEEERKRKEEKDARKEAKKKSKEEKKEAKQAEKLAKKGGASTAPLYAADTNESSSTMASAGMTQSDSNIGASSLVPEEQVQGKGKGPAQDFAGFVPLLEPTSTLNTEMQDPDRHEAPSPTRGDAFGSVSGDAQKHLEESRANLHPPSGIPIPEPRRLSPSHARHTSDTASLTSSTNESPSPPGSLRGDSNVPSANSGSGVDVSGGAAQDATAARSGTPPLEPMLNFRSLTAMIEDEDKGAHEDASHMQQAEQASQAEEALKEPSPTGSPRITPAVVEGNRSRGNSRGSAPPPGYGEDDDQITPAPTVLGVVHNVDDKDIGKIDVLDRGHNDVHQATQ